MADEDKKPKADKAAAAKGGKGAPQGGKGKRAAAEKADKGPAPLVPPIANPITPTWKQEAKEGGSEPETNQ